MNQFEEKIIKGKLTALEVGLQSGAIPLHIIRQDTLRLLEINDIPEDLELRLRNLLIATAEDDMENPYAESTENIG